MVQSQEAQARTRAFGHGPLDATLDRLMMQSKLGGREFAFRTSPLCWDKTRRTRTALFTMAIVGRRHLPNPIHSAFASQFVKW